jgi:hypothetical protein
LGQAMAVKASVPLERHGSCVSVEGLEDSVESPSDDLVTAADPFFLVPDSTTDATQQPESQEPEGGVRAGGAEGEKVGVARARQRPPMLMATWGRSEGSVGMDGRGSRRLKRAGSTGDNTDVEQYRSQSARTPLSPGLQTPRLRRDGERGRAEPLPRHLRFHFYVCHKVTTGRHIAKALSQVLLAEGFKPWLDIDVGHDATTGHHGPTAENMLRGIQDSACVLLVLTKDVLRSEWCQKELRWAADAKKQVVCVHDTEKDDPNYFDFKVETRTAPPWLVQLVQGQDSIPYRTKHFEEEAMIKAIVYRSRSAWRSASAISTAATAAIATVTLPPRQLHMQRKTPCRFSRPDTVADSIAPAAPVALATEPPAPQPDEPDDGMVVPESGLCVSSPRPGSARFMRSPSKTDVAVDRFTTIYQNAQQAYEQGHYERALLLFYDIQEAGQQDVTLDTHLCDLYIDRIKTRLRTVRAELSPESSPRSSPRHSPKMSGGNGGLFSCCAAPHE